MVFGNAVYAGCQWLIIVVISNFGSPTDVGIYAFGLAIVGPVFILVNMGLRQAITTDVSNSWNFSSYFRLRIQSLLLGSLLVVIYVWWRGELDHTSIIIFLLGGSKIVDGILDIYYGFMQRYHRLDIVSLSRILTGILGASFFTIVYFLSQNLQLSIIFLILGWSISAFIVGYNYLNKIYIEKHSVEKLKLLDEQDLKFDKKLFWLVLPLGWTALFISLRTNIPRYFIEAEIGMIELGVFAATGYLIHLMGIVVAALGRTACPRLAEFAISGEKDKFLKMLNLLLLIAFILGTIGIMISLFWSVELITLFYGEQMAQYSEIFLYMMVVALMSYICGFLNYALEALRIFKRHFAISFFSTLICLISCYFLIPNYGMVGACVGWALALLSQAILSVFFIYRKLGQNAENR